MRVGWVQSARASARSAGGLACALSIGLSISMVGGGVERRQAHPSPARVVVDGRGITTAGGPNTPVSASRLAISADSRGKTQANLSRSYGRLPLSFEAAPGPAEGGPRFLARGDGFALFLSRTEVTLALRLPSARRKAKSETRKSKLETRNTEPAPRIPNPECKERAVLRMSLVGANRSAEIAGIEQLAGRSHYLIGNDAGRWRTGIANYAKVRSGGGLSRR